METYFLKAEQTKPNVNQRLRMFFVYACLYFLLMFTAKLLWPTTLDKNEGILARAAYAAVMSIIWAAGMTIWWKRTLPNSTIVVDDYSITATSQYPGWMRWLKTSRTVRRGEIRTIWDIRNSKGTVLGTAISEKGKLYSRFFFGFVFLSTRLQEYEKLRAIAELWRSPNV
jgi:hypothetical protein